MQWPVDTPALAVFADPAALAIVGGGTLFATALRGPLADSVAALTALRRLFGRPIAADDVRARIIQAERVTRGNLHAADPRLLADSDVARTVEAIADGAGPEAVSALLDELAAARAIRHAVVHDWWTAAAETAPAMGMVGTLVGLVGMFAAMNDPATIGGAMAIALLATLYGAIGANLIAAPIAARLRRQSAREAEARRDLIGPLCALARRQAVPAPPRRKAA